MPYSQPAAVVVDLEAKRNSFMDNFLRRPFTVRAGRIEFPMRSPQSASAVGPNPDDHLAQRMVVIAFCEMVVRAWTRSLLDHVVRARNLPLL